MPKKVWLLVIAMIINVTGSSFLWPFNSIYIHQELGKSMAVAGSVLMLNSLTGVFGNLAGGILFDKWGGYKSLLIGVVITLLSVAGLVLYHDWPMYVLWLALIGFGSGMVFPAMYAMIAAVWPEGGRKAFNAMYIAQNVGVAVGSALGGLVAAYRFEYIFSANLALYIVFFLLALFGFRGMQTVSIEEKEKGAWELTPAFRSLLILCVAYMLCWFAYTQWQATISTHMQSLHISLKSYSLLWTINGLMIVLAQPLISALIRRMKSTLKQQVIIGTSIYIVSFFLVSQAEQFTMFLAAMLVLTIGEMFVWPAVPTIANELAPEGKLGFYQGVVNSAATAGRMIGPLAGGIIVDAFGIYVLFIGLLAMLFIAILITVVYDKQMKENEHETVSF